MIAPRVQAPPAKSASSRYRKRIRPLAPGFSVGHVGVSAGTLGGFVVDVKGRPVPGADLQPETPPMLAKEFTYDINVDLRGRVPIGSPLQEPQLNVGRITLTPDGRLAFNGKPLADPEGVAIAELCQRRAR